MNILHINSFSQGGAFNGSHRLHKALLKYGLNSKMLLRELDDKDQIEEAYLYSKTFRKRNLVNRIKTKLGYPQTCEQRMWRYRNGLNGMYEIISFPFSDYDITQSKEYQEADIIHLHWIGDFLDFETFFNKNTKPVVWTLRDANPFLGIFHLVNDLKRNNAFLENLDNEMITFKQKCLDKSKTVLQIVGLSNDICNKSKESQLLKNYEHQVIHNCIDLKDYEIIDKKYARKRLNIDDNKIVFCFVASSISRFSKGFKELSEAIHMLNSENLEFVSVGDGHFDSFNFSIRHRHLGKLSSDNLKLVYSASDAFIFPTKEEALGNVMLEAMACGTPVIGTPIGGLLDVIIDGFNGVFAKNTSPYALKEAIERFISIKDQFNPNEIRQFIQNNFSEQKIAESYFQLYSKLLNA